jgi:hypothetical protein
MQSSSSSSSIIITSESFSQLHYDDIQALHRIATCVDPNLVVDSLTSTDMDQLGRAVACTLREWAIPESQISDMERGFSCDLDPMGSCRFAILFYNQGHIPW